MERVDNTTRRGFLAVVSGIGFSHILTEPVDLIASPVQHKPFLFGGFTKSLFHLGLNFEQTAEVAAEIGWDGIECPVRKNGQVLPQRVADDLPKMAHALAAKNLKILVIATDILNPKQEHTEKVLRTASKLGIKYYRMGWWYYEKGKSIPDRLRQVKAQLRDIETLNRELGICGIYHNHSGDRFVGAPLWDTYELLRDLDHRYIAADFDIGHATVEGGYAWSIHFRLMQPLIGGLVVKDFTWEHIPEKGWQASWCPLGKGMVSKKFFAMLKQSKWQGPVIQHFEYPVEGRNAKHQLDNRIRAMKRDLQKLRSLLS